MRTGMRKARLFCGILMTVTVNTLVCSLSPAAVSVSSLHPYKSTQLGRTNSELFVAQNLGSSRRRNILLTRSRISGFDSRQSSVGASLTPASTALTDPDGSFELTFASKVKQILSKRFRQSSPMKKGNLLLGFAMLGSLLLCRPRPVLAATKLFSSPMTSDALLSTARALVKAALIPLASISLYLHLKVKQRQAKDATSEWNRFAQYPGARGRAIVTSVLLPQAFLIVMSKIFWFRASSIRRCAGKSFAQALLQLGPLYIKLGQILSCQKNLLGEEWITAMERLQDQVPARTGQDALDLAYSTVKGGKQEFESIFETFDTTPLAAASLGQVHKATLRKKVGVDDNPDEPPEVVAVKVQRPYLRKIYDQDFKFLTKIATFMDKMPSKGRDVGGIQNSWTAIFEDAEEILYREIDYRDEAKNGVRFCKDFGLTKGGRAVNPIAKSRNNETLPSAADWLRVPYVYDDLSNEQLLVMEFVPSIKITNSEKLAAANVTEMDKIDLADSLARAYLRQFCCNLFFSTDPHPGNLGVEIVEETNKPRLVMYDFGQAASLTQGQADGILSIIEAIIDQDVDKSIEAFQTMKVLVEDANLDLVRKKVADNYRTGKIKANQKTLKRRGYKRNDGKPDSSISAGVGVPEDATAVETLRSKKETRQDDMEVMSFFTLPAEYAFVGRAISQMDGVGKGLDPDFDFISSSAPYIVEIEGASKYLKEQALKIILDFQKKIAKFQINLMEKKVDGNQ